MFTYHQASVSFRYSQLLWITMRLNLKLNFSFKIIAFICIFLNASICFSEEKHNFVEMCALFSERTYDNYNSFNSFWGKISPIGLKKCISNEGMINDALEYSILFRNFEASKIYLENGANPNGDKIGIPLISAVIKKSKKTIKLLLEYGADPNLLDNLGMGALHYSSSLEIDRLLLEAGADSSIMGFYGTPLAIAAMDRGGTERVRQYLKYGAKAEQEYDGLPILFHAYHQCSYSVGTIAALIAHGANPNIIYESKDPNMYFIHFLSGQSGCEHDLKATIIDGGVDVDWRTVKTGVTPLMIASGSKDILKTIDTLHELGANLDARDILGNTPLHNAVQFGHPENVTRLLKLGANAKLKNAKGKTPFDYAERIKGTQAYWLLNEANY